MEPKAYTIDIKPLLKPARKPRHLEKRWRSKQSHISKPESITSRHEAFLAARKHKLSVHIAYVKNTIAKVRHQRKLSTDVKINKIEETLELANKNRTDLINKSVAFHSKHVHRAKEIARFHQQQSIESSAMLAKDLETRLRISDFRRDRLLKIPRSRILDPQSWAMQESIAVRDEAAMFIQSWWRTIKFAPLRKIYKKIGLTREKAKTMSFAKLTAQIQSPVMIKAATFMLAHARKMVGKKSRGLKDSARVFLSAYMLFAHPTQVFIQKSAQEEDLSFLAEKLVCDVDYWISSSQSVIAALAQKLLVTFTAYHTAFDAWKSNDTVKITDELILHFIELDKLWLSVCEQEKSYEEWAMAIQDQQSQHLTRLKKFGSSAINRLITAREELKTYIITNAIFDVSIDENADPIATASLVYIHKKDVVMDTVVQRAETINGDLPTANDLSQFGQILSNEQLAHELVMDPNFKLKVYERSPLEAQVADIARQAFQDTVRSEIARGIFSKSVLGLAADIKQGLLGMVDEKGPIAAEIKEVFDHEFLLHQAQNNVFDLYKLAHYAGDKMLQLCAPVRDAEIREIGEEKDIVVILFKALDLLEEMKIDLANFRLQSIKPHLIHQAVEYEKLKFDQALQKGSVALTKTRDWLTASANDLQKIADSRNPENLDHPDNRLKFNGILNHAYLSLLFSTTPLNPLTLAETLSMDAQRIFEMQNEVQAITIVSALAMLSKNMIPPLRAEPSAMRQLSVSLFNLLKSKGTNIDRLVAEIVGAGNSAYHQQMNSMVELSAMTSTPIVQVLKQITSDETDLIKSMVLKTISHQDPFFSVLNRRVEKIIKVSIESSFRRDSLSKNGLDLIEGELEDLVKRISALVKHNKNVYAVHYDGILKTLVV